MCTCFKVKETVTFGLELIASHDWNRVVLVSRKRFYAICPNKKLKINNK